MSSLFFQSFLFTLLFWLLLIPVLWSYGSLLGNKIPLYNPSLRGVINLALGLGVLGFYLSVVGILGLFQKEALFIFMILALVVSRQKSFEVFQWFSEIFAQLTKDKSFFSKSIQWMLLFALTITFLICFLPEISNDALAIQLHISKLFVTEQSIRPSEFDLFSYRPLFMSLLYSCGLMFKNVAIAKLFHWFTGFLSILALIIKAEEKTSKKDLALFAGLMLWLTPTLLNQITTTYIDGGITLFIFLGFCLLDELDQKISFQHFFYTGLFYGIAISIRYLSLSAVIASLPWVLFLLFQKNPKAKILQGIGLGMLGVILGSGFWFLRAWHFTSNPVYPYLGKLFGTEDFDFFTTIYYHGMGLPRSWQSFLLLPWNLTFLPHHFDYHHWLGPFYLAAFPLFIYSLFRLKDLRKAGSFILFFTITWYFTGQNVRYLLPVFPIYLFIIVWGIARFSQEKFFNRFWKILVHALQVGSILFLIALMLYHFRYQFKPLSREWSQKEYLLKMERTTGIADWVNQNLPPQAKVLILEEVHLYYFDRPVLLDFDFNVRTKYKELSTAAEIAERIKEKGVTHILDAIDLNQPSLEGSRPIDHLLKDTSKVELKTTLDSSHILGFPYRYKIYQLK